MLSSFVYFYVRDANNTGETSYSMSKLPFFRNLENLSRLEKKISWVAEFSFYKPIDHGISERDQVKINIVMKIQISEQMLKTRGQTQNKVAYD